MKNKKTLWLPICWGIYFLLVMISLFVPAMKMKDLKLSASIFDLFSVGSLSSSSSSSYTVGLNSFYSIIIVLTFFVPVILSFVKKDLCKYFSLGLSITLFAFMLNYVKSVSELKDASSAYEDLSVPGIIILFIATIGAMIISAIDVFVTFYYEKLVTSLSANANHNNTLDMLEENKNMLDKGLITQEEYDARRSKILGE